MLSAKQTMELIKMLIDRGIKDTTKWTNEHSEADCLKFIRDGFINSYMLIEDTGSGYQFWDNVIKSKFNREHGVLHLVSDLNFPSGGVDHLRLAMLNILKDPKNCANCYYIICDEVPDLSGPALIARESVYTLCKTHSSLFKRLEGCLSFESVILSFSELVEWLLIQNSNKSDHVSDFTDICKIINSREMYQLISAAGDKNIETYLSSYLQELTCDTKLRIVKKHLSICWQEPCCFSKYDSCSLSMSLKEINKCFYVFSNSYIADLLDGVIL